jgi:hypothetical protein
MIGVFVNQVYHQAVSRRVSRSCDDEVGMKSIFLGGQRELQSSRRPPSLYCPVLVSLGRDSARAARHISVTDGNIPTEACGREVLQLEEVAIVGDVG